MNIDKLNRFGFRTIPSVREHKPSGVLIVWAGKDNKIHTKSIPNKQTFIGYRQIELDTKTELLLKQLECLQYDFETSTNHPVMVTRGLTRKEAREALKNEIETKG